MKKSVPIATDAANSKCKNNVTSHVNKNYVFELPLFMSGNPESFPVMLIKCCEFICKSTDSGN